MDLDRGNVVKQNLILQNKLRKLIKKIFFLQLKKDLYLKNGIKISKNVPIPVFSEDFANEVSTGLYDESIPPDNVVCGMALMVGCDGDFKYNKHYIDILKSIQNIDKYIMHMAHESRKKKNFLYSLAYMKTLMEISDKHEESIFNYAHVLREMAMYAKERGDEEEYRLYYDLSYSQYSILCKEYPHFPYSHYHIGFYDFNEGKYEEALDHWEKAYNLINEHELKEEIKKLLESTREKIDFESGKKYIKENNINKGLKILLPLMEKHKDWSEVKYFIALGYRKLGNYIKAEILLNELLDMGEDFPEIFNELGLCTFYQGNTDKSVKLFEKAVDKKREPGFLCNLGIAYYKAGDTQKAKESIEEAYKMDPRDELTKQCREWINKA